MPPLHNVGLTPLEVVEKLVDVVDALACLVTSRQPELCGIAIIYRFAVKTALHDLSMTCG